MKKILINTFILLLVSSNLDAHISHYKNFKKIEMEIFRNNELIGYNYYFFKRNGEVTKIINQIKFTVKLLGTTIFDVEGYGEEKYNKNDLISFSSKTLQNDKIKFVNLTLDKKNNKFLIDGSSYRGTADTNNIIGNWWNHKLLQANSQISPISGSVKKQIVTFIGKEKIKIYGKNYHVDHYKLTSKNKDLPKNKRLDFDVWFNKKTGMILKVKYSRMGVWEYRLKSFE
jgi:hypothetical protein|tara:strand:+ start:180 stop:863 length:684 start_codon:yes stop_codon:yes gene_type:complete